MKDLEERVLKRFPLSQMHLFQKGKEGRVEAIREILISRIIITPKEDLRLREKTLSAFIVKKWVI